MSSTIDKIKSPINRELKKFEPYFSSIVKSDISLLNIITRYVLKTKGKQMRPMMVFLVAGLWGELNASTHRGAALIELMHTATLTHDDVVDNSNQRRGFFSINALWKNKVAVLLGDFLLSKGLLLAVDNKDFDLLQIVSRAVKDMSEGELLQIEKTRKLNITEEIYHEIIRKKTAVLLAACAAVGAKSVGKENKIVEQMWQMGEYIGMAFQIKDDLFDLDINNKTGKPAGNDLQEKKMTLPLIYALEQVDASKKRKIKKIVAKNKKTKDDIKLLVEFIKNNGGIEYAEKQMHQFSKLALDVLQETENSIYKESLESLINYTITRNK
jgi:octaprenyl-diphosphate synthase